MGVVGQVQVEVKVAVVVGGGWRHAEVGREVEGDRAWWGDTVW